MGSPCSIRRAPWTPTIAARCTLFSSILARSHFPSNAAPVLHNSFSRLRCKQPFAKLQISMKQAGGLGGLVLQIPGAEKLDPGELPNFEAICYLFTIDRGYSHAAPATQKHFGDHRGDRHRAQRPRP